MRDAERRGGPRAGLADSVAIAIATAGGAGLFPVAPGTAGSAVGAALYLVIFSTGFGGIYLPATALIAVTGIWAAGRVEAIYGHDASKIVVDEVAGQMLTLAFVLRSGATALLVGTILGFLLFRFFDILKPFPIRRLERLPGGVGVMADDLGAALYALLVLLLLEPLASGMVGSL